MERIEFDLFVIPMNGLVKLAKTFEHKSEAIIAFNMIVEDGKMRAAFLDEREEFSNNTRSVKNVMKWRKRANKTKGQSG
jgi:hypothetical protein